jgi:putative endonuclease
MEWLQQKRISWLETTLAVLKGAVRRSSVSTGRAAHLTTGIDGEDAAFFYLRRKGYIVVARRWATGYQRGDLDLIAWQGPMLCFIEVKTRTAHDMAAAEAAVDWQKRSTVRKLARRYVRQLPMKASPPVRFDILSVYLVPGKEKEFVHFEAAFGWSEPSQWDRWDDWS